MALVPCPECQKPVSTEAVACPQCAYPYPGKKPPHLEASPSRLNACPDCGSPVSKQAHACPHCGVSLLKEPQGSSSLGHEEGAVEETWLCPHCGTPYTRKVRRSVVGTEEPREKRQEMVPESPQPTSAKDECESLVVISEPTHNPLAKRRPALWQDNFIPKETEASPPKYPRGRKKSIILIIVMLILVMVGGGLGALWQFKGITPIELFTYLKM
ncbi:MAG: zinc ribbon domain-containing protein [Nitrospirales bacterium]